MTRMGRPPIHPSVKAGSRAAKRRAYLKNRAIIEQLKSNPCADCGVSFHHELMDFDHRDPSTKTGKITAFVHGSSVRLLREIAKCDVVCAMCHRKRTVARRQHIARPSTTSAAS